MCDNPLMSYSDHYLNSTNLSTHSFNNRRNICLFHYANCHYNHWSCAIFLSSDLSTSRPSHSCFYSKISSFLGYNLDSHVFFSRRSAIISKRRHSQCKYTSKSYPTKAVFILPVEFAHIPNIQPVQDVRYMQKNDSLIISAAVDLKISGNMTGPSSNSATLDKLSSKANDINTQGNNNIVKDHGNSNIDSIDHENPEIFPPELESKPTIPVMRGSPEKSSSDIPLVHLFWSLLLNIQHLSQSIVNFAENLPFKLPSFKQASKLFYEFAVVFVLGLLLRLGVSKTLRLIHSRIDRKKVLNYNDSVFESMQGPLEFLSIFVVGTALAEFVSRPLAATGLLKYIRLTRELGFIFAGTWFLLRWIGKIRKRFTQDARSDNAQVDVLSRISAVGTVAIGLLMAFDTMGVNVKTVLAFGGIGGVAIGFAGKEIISNFFGGFMIFVTRPFVAGEWIRSVQDRNLEGTVEEIGWYLTRIRNWDKRPMYVPNSQFTTLVIENPSRMTNRRILHTIHIRLEDALVAEDIVESIRSMLAANNDLDSKQHKMAFVDGFTEFSVKIWISCFTKSIFFNEYRQAQQDILLSVHKIVRMHGARLASNLVRDLREGVDPDRYGPRNNVPILFADADARPLDLREDKNKSQKPPEPSTVNLKKPVSTTSMASPGFAGKEKVVVSDEKSRSQELSKNAEENGQSSSPQRETPISPTIVSDPIFTESAMYAKAPSVTASEVDKKSQIKIVGENINTPTAVPVESVIIDNPDGVRVIRNAHASTGGRDSSSNDAKESTKQATTDEKASISNNNDSTNLGTSLNTPITVDSVIIENPDHVRVIREAHASNRDSSSNDSKDSAKQGMDEKTLVSKNVPLKNDPSEDVRVIRDMMPEKSGNSSNDKSVTHDLIDSKVVSEDSTLKTNTNIFNENGKRLNSTLIDSEIRIIRETSLSNVNGGDPETAKSNELEWKLLRERDVPVVSDTTSQDGVDTSLGRRNGVGSCKPAAEEASSSTAAEVSSREPKAGQNERSPRVSELSELSENAIGREVNVPEGKRHMKIVGEVFSQSIAVREEMDAPEKENTMLGNFRVIREAQPANSSGSKGKSLESMQDTMRELSESEKESKAGDSKEKA